MTRLLAVFVLAAAAGTAPAHAEGPSTVRLSYHHYSVPLDAGSLVVVVCGASAALGPAQVAVVTEVRCSAGGAEASAVLPGGEAVTAVVTPVLGSTTVCVYGEAVFVDAVGGVVRAVSRGPECATLTP